MGWTNARANSPNDPCFKDPRDKTEQGRGSRKQPSECVCTCACPPTSCAQPPSGTPSRAYRCCLQAADFGEVSGSRSEKNDGVAAIRLHSRFRLRALSQTRAPGVDPSTSEFSEFPAYWRVKLDSRSRLPACGKPLGAGSGGYGAQRIKKGDCGCREIYSSNTDFVVAKFRLGICIWKFFMKVLILTTWIALLRDWSS